jgi:hypothetical protein
MQYTTITVFTKLHPFHNENYAHGISLYLHLFPPVTS